MKLRTPALRSQISRDRDEYIRESLTSFSTLSARLSSRADDPELKTKPFGLEFHREWRDPSCKVTKWYNTIAPSSTQFTSIEHRKTLNAPFFHEFLVINLTDGATCRLERMGDGSRTDALRFVGSTAHDIIQWFPPGDYLTTPAGQQPSEVVIAIEFPHPFDLLDALAVCYAMQRHSRASLYTLQRYNCYFLCITVLAVLTRRIGEWENLLTQDAWSTIVDGAINELPHMKHDDVHDHFSIGVCSLLETDAPGTTNHVLEALGPGLGSDARESLKEGLAQTLWEADLQAASQKSLSPHVEGSTSEAFRGDSPSATILRRLLGPLNHSFFPATELKDPRTQRMVLKQNCVATANHRKRMRESVYRDYKMAQVENGRRSVTIEVLASIGGAVIGICAIPIVFMKFSRDNAMGGYDKSDIRLQARVAYHSVFMALQAGKLVAFRQLDPQFRQLTVNAMSNRHELSISLFEVYRLPVIDTRGKALHLIHTELQRNQWYYHLDFAVSRLISEALPTLLASKVFTITSSETASWTTADFQVHLHRRIEDHACRVDTFGLAAGPLVRGDIQRAMSEVWRSLPKGFGGATVERPPGVEVPQASLTEALHPFRPQSSTPVASKSRSRFRFSPKRSDDDRIKALLNREVVGRSLRRVTGSTGPGSQALSQVST